MQERAKVRSFAEWAEKYPPHKAPEWLKVATAIVAFALEGLLLVIVWSL